MLKGIYAHAARGVIRISGDERVDFLQGLITQDVRKVQPQQAQYGAFLTPQGRFLYDFFLFSDGQALYLTPEQAYLKAFMQKLTLYKLRRQVTLVDVSDTLALYSWWGVTADSVMSSVDPRHPSLGYIGLSSQLTSTLTVMDYDSARIPLALPDGTRDMPFEKAIPLEHNLDKANAVDWDKGCYMGQELTARTRYRGLVRKRLFALQKQSGDMPQQGTPVLLGDEEIGDVRSHTDTLALAYLRIEQAESSSLLQAGQATFAVLPS